MEKRMITTDVTEEDFPLEGNLRPQTLEEYIGQEKTKKNTENLYRSSQTAKGCAGSRAFLRPSRTGKNNFVRNHCK